MCYTIKGAIQLVALLCTVKGAMLLKVLCH